MQLSRLVVQEKLTILKNFFFHILESRNIPIHEAKGYKFELAFSTLSEQNVKLVHSKPSMVSLDIQLDQVFFNVSFKHTKCIKMVA